MAMLIVDFLNGTQGIFPFDTLEACLRFEFYQINSDQIVASACELVE